MKEILKIEPLKTINEILDSFPFLEYSAYKRNLAYQIQFLNFLLKLYKNYHINRGLENIYIRHIFICSANIIEYLLFISLYQVYKKIPKDKPHSLARQAKIKNLITKDLSKRIDRIFTKRNKLHPKKQLNLDVKDFSNSDRINCINVIKKLINSLSSYFDKRNEKISIKYQNSGCAYCSSGGLFNDGDICPACGRLII